MRASEAWGIADEWLKTEWLPDVESSGKGHGFVGAYIMGSLASLPAEAEFKNRASDIDVALVIDPEVLPFDPRYPDGKFSVFRECIIQAIFVPMAVLDEEEKLLTMLGLGCNLRNGRILSDSSGRLQEAKDVVADSWAAPAWTARRFERARTFATTAFEEMPAASDPIGRLGSFCGVMMQLAGLPAIATRETPTHRRCLIKAAVIMRDRGREDLYDRLLAAVGAQDAEIGDVEALVAYGLVALETEQRYAEDTPGLSPELRSALPALTVAGPMDLVEDGWVREAVLPALMNVWMSASLVARVGSAEEVEALQKLAAAGLERVGLSEQAWPARIELARELLGDLGDWCAEQASAA